MTTEFGTRSVPRLLHRFRGRSQGHAGSLQTDGNGGASGGAVRRARERHQGPEGGGDGGEGRSDAIGVNHMIRSLRRVASVCLSSSSQSEPGLRVCDNRTGQGIWLR